ncbi:hypothetical protein HPB52_001871 [Rhipicephalus sanguineus]|uniref:Kelch repeat protein n=1 Tax=Rhipicephalus sanguineus TaxID=34632 RepID=A0A9D4Q482_RHISA|nr:hypothetical protein HPB52_001871 [Rhipicephalus sanguineus]
MVPDGTVRVDLHYHVLKNRWYLCGMMPEPRSYHAAVLIGNTVYVTGGLDRETRKGGDLLACKTTFAYDIDTMEWSLKADTKTGEAAHGAASFKDKFFCCRRQRTLGTSSASSRDPSSLKLDQGDQDKCRRPHEPPKNLVRRRSNGRCCHWPPSRITLDSKTFLGVETLKVRTPLSRPSLPRFYHYVPTAPANDPYSGITVRVDDDFKRTKEVLGLRDASGLPAFARKLRRVKKVQDEALPIILTFGGLDPRDPLNYANGKLLRQTQELVACKTTFAYDIDTMEWSRKADMKTGRAAHGAAAFKEKLFVFGGRGRLGRAVESTEE